MFTYKILWLQSRDLVFYLPTIKSEPQRYVWAALSYNWDKSGLPILSKSKHGWMVLQNSFQCQFLMYSYCNLWYFYTLPLAEQQCKSLGAYPFPCLVTFHNVIYKTFQNAPSSIVITWNLISQWNRSVTLPIRTCRLISLLSALIYTHMEFYAKMADKWGDTYQWWCQVHAWGGSFINTPVLIDIKLAQLQNWRLHKL